MVNNPFISYFVEKKKTPLSRGYQYITESTIQTFSLINNLINMKLHTYKVEKINKIIIFFFKLFEFEVISKFFPQLLKLTIYILDYCIMSM